MAVAAGAAGVTLVLIGTSTPLRTPLVVLFLAVAPTAAVAGLLRGIDAFARLIVACTATVVVGALAAEVTLAAGVWSPRAGLVVIVVITAVAFAIQLPGFSAPARGPPGRSLRLLPPSLTPAKPSQLPNPAASIHRIRRAPTCLHTGY